MDESRMHVFIMPSSPLRRLRGSFLPPVALSTNARKTRSSSPACSRSATNGRALLIDASTAGEWRNAVEHRLVQRLLDLLQAGHDCELTFFV